MTHKEKFIELLTKAAKGANYYNVFNDFLKVTATSLARFDESNLDVWQEREKIFKDTLERYDVDTQKLFVEMFAELGLELNDNSQSPRYRDVLGGIFQGMELYDRKNGQVFTPPHIGKLMGDIAMDKDFIQSEIEKSGYLRIVEPCCGSGAITLNALNTILESGVNPCKHCFVEAYDMDERCILMIFIQLSLYRIPAIVMLKDAITQKVVSAAWRT